ncbi:pyruvate/2-oxoglutarate dehydrogenase complex, dehydrogenase component alpha subunit [Frankia casuarinae]|jgi:pyruvate dehydrogenase E1 component alpha subunit|uniref:Pyruvate dehydrogenase n=1 Tax=Frankia casuarinae (strain DSM 45818 / CECT 9043 / HFP020203 / CcI3) TaxID=106370 RepID=Q2JA37_FRACC|nr:MULTISPECIES: pyruvate dehydrogenase (acetyl-transferring) E1 component subunit alpha [Frankia]ABD11855.1 pyruvate dehydrogenase [Frankia casuarinae]ETA00734.1 pyruvate/2-oxoglutarate dehydrogenase complex, dehydrogenase component alpha subunit [Frankia sp. CcI6]EYT90648.1 pyruvate/2-oxoglutarate dehydrogenase complex, dehydrogenase component alpha subunit [Frankia casuarinae]OAA21040.1 pyruvate dehydrogenase E1 component alpha subunit [Frankia casuarinae]OFB40979.1 pyruvate dehydrogenase (
MTILDDSTAPGFVGPPSSHGPRRDPAPLLPDPEPVRVLGTEAAGKVDTDLLRVLYHRLVLGRRFNQQATTLARQGRLAVYPASTGQEACQIAAAMVLRESDWLFPSYRDTLAVVSRGVRPVDALTLMRGNAHSGYDPREHRIAPLSTPLATQACHAVGLAHAARLRAASDPWAAEDVVALALIGDGGTSEGDFHEALNFAGVLNAPVVFLVQNNGYAISVPLAQQSAAPTLAHKAVGHGIIGRLVDGNDAPAVHGVLRAAVEHARSGRGPVLVEAVTYRLEAHTNADDATRYRTSEEVAAWQARDPLTLLERQLRKAGLLDDAGVAAVARAAEELAAEMRAQFDRVPDLDPGSLFTHVYAQPTSQLREQAAELMAWQAADAAKSDDAR